MAGVSGVCGWLIYPNTDVWWLVFVCNVPLLTALGDATLSRRRRFLLGWVTGFVLTAGSHHFIAGTLVHFGGLPWLGALPLFGVYCAWTGIQLGLFAVGYGPIRRWCGPGLSIVAISLWFALLERVWPVWFQAYISNVFWHAPVFTQSLEIVGPSGLTALVMALQCALTHGWERRDWRVPAVAVVGWVALVGWGSWRVDAVRAVEPDRTVKVAMIQANMTIEEKRAGDPKVRADVFRRTVKRTLDALTHDPDLIVWPEGAFVFNYERAAIDTPRKDRERYATRYSRALHELAKRLDRPFVAPGLRRDDDGRIRNAALFFTPNQKWPSVYDKRVLVWLAEEIPFADTFPSLQKAVPAASNHAPGDRYTHFDVAGVRWVPGICYENVFPTVTREALAHNTHDAGLDVLLNLTNDVWFGDGSEGPVHLMMQIPRTVENRVWLVRSTNSGITAVVDPTGTIVARTDQAVEDTLVFDVPVSRRVPTLYYRFGDVPLVVLGALVVGLPFLRRRRDAA